MAPIVCTHGVVPSAFTIKRSRRPIHTHTHTHTCIEEEEEEGKNKKPAAKLDFSFFSFFFFLCSYPQSVLNGNQVNRATTIERWKEGRDGWKDNTHKNRAQKLTPIMSSLLAAAAAEAEAFSHSSVISLCASVYCEQRFAY